MFEESCVERQGLLNCSPCFLGLKSERYVRDVEGVGSHPVTLIFFFYFSILRLPKKVIV